MLKKILPIFFSSLGFVYAQTAQDSGVISDTVGVAPVEDLYENLLTFDEPPVISLDDEDISDGISSQLTAGRDPYFSSATFNWGAARFKIRGYGNDNFVTYMNGVPMEALDIGGSTFYLWSGLNDVLRSRDNSMGLKPTTYSFGGIGGQFFIDSRASKQWKQLRVGYAATNRNYRNRLMATYSTGITKSGWAFSLSASRRWAHEGYIEGTFYDGWSYFTSAEKIFNKNHALALTVFGAPAKTGAGAGVVQELYDLTGSPYYNPNWGYQNGKKRSSKVNNSHQPTFILTHEYSPNNNLNILSAASYTFGVREQATLDWYNVRDPRPEFYRNLPSFILDEDYRSELIERIKEDPALLQVDWNRMYEVNRNNIETVRNVDGVSGNDITGKRSRYIIERRLTDVQRANANTIINATISNKLEFTGGASYQFLKNRMYKKIGDLLGGDFYVNLNQFAERDFPGSDANQNDINRPNQILKEGDKFGYDYDMNFHKASAWGQLRGTWNKTDAFISAEISHTNFSRTGHNKNGLFLEDSYGKSKAQNFLNGGVKGGVTYKIDGRNYLFANAGYSTRAPYFRDIFVSPRTRTTTVRNPKSEKIASVESGYVLNTPEVKARFTGYFTKFNDQTRTLSFYHDDYRNFVNYSLTNIDKIHVGAELGIEAKIYKGLSTTIAATMGRHFFTSRQRAEVTLDNSAEILSDNEIVFSEYFKVGGTPQSAATFGLNYRSPKFWFVNLNFNYFAEQWMDFNPIRRTWEAVDGVDNPSDKYDYIIKQEKLKNQFTMDIFGGYSWRIDKSIKKVKKSQYIYLNVGINNLTNNRKHITGGYEQLRYDFDNQNPDKFPSRYFYAYGINYFISIAYRI